MAKEKPAVQAIDKEDVAKNINTIVDLMLSIDASRDLINTKIKYLKDTYGLNSTNVRTAATAIKNEKVDEISDKLSNIQELIDLCIS